MKFIAIHKGRQVEIEVRRQDTHRYRVWIDGQDLDLDARMSEGKALSILVGSRSLDVFYTQNGNRLELIVGNRNFPIEFFDHRKAGPETRSGFGTATGPEQIKSVMPGKIIQVMVKPGEKIKAGQSVVTVEAMKMENEICCCRDGTVTSVLASPGDVVEGGALLVEITPLD